MIKSQHTMNSIVDMIEAINKNLLSVQKLVIQKKLIMGNKLILNKKIKNQSQNLLLE